jgi:hypothetical protein
MKQICVAAHLELLFCFANKMEFAKNKISLRLFVKTSRNFTRVKVFSGGIKYVPAEFKKCSVLGAKRNSVLVIFRRNLRNINGITVPFRFWRENGKSVFSNVRLSSQEHYDHRQSDPATTEGDTVLILVDKHSFL